ncbi:MAG: DNA recombination protein RmuC [Betaproteobacteria bacterium]
MVGLTGRKGQADEVRASARDLREELAAGAERTSQAVLAQMTSIATVQNNQIDGFSRQLAELVAANERRLQDLRETVDTKLREAKEDARLGRDESGATLKRFGDTLGERFAEIRQTVETRLDTLQKDNAEKLEKMRATVDEKLHETLEKRLGESFKQVADRLEQVHKGLGEMQSLAADVGGLKQVLSNVKTLGLAGEMQLAALLEQALAPEQYARNVVTRPRSRDPVEFAIRLPGRDVEGHIWLPIDSKFPIADYQTLLQAQEAGDVAGAQAAAKALEARVKLEAKSIRDKYVEPPATTDFAILFVPTEGLYAEILRRPGLFQVLQKDFRVTVCGPVNLIAFLNSLQMGFRTLAIEKRSSEVWAVLGAVKTEFENFGKVLANTKRQLEAVTNSIDSAETRTRQMARKLKGVEALPEPVASKLLESPGDDLIPGG